MGKTLLISNIKIADSVKESFIGDVFLENGKIIEVAGSIRREADIHVDATGEGWILVPGFIDIHIHGAVGL